MEEFPQMLSEYVSNSVEFRRLGVFLRLNEVGQKENGMAREEDGVLSSCQVS